MYGVHISTFNNNNDNNKKKKHQVLIKIMNGGIERESVKSGKEI